MQSAFSMPSDGTLFLPGAAEGSSPVAFEAVGTLRLPAPGLLMLHCQSTRPLKLWIGRHLVFEDELQRERTYICRRMILAATLPLGAGEHAVHLAAGLPARHISWVDEHCADPRRHDTLAAVARHLPDGITLTTTFTPTAGGPAVALRFEPGQFRETGRWWQDVRVRPLAGFRPSPSPWKSWEEKLPDPTPALSTPLGQARRVAPFPGRPADELRFYVPVWEGDPPAARDIGPDARGESIRAIVAEVPLNLATPEGAATLSLPVFEILGRRAPVREHRDIPPPQPEAVLAAAPRPILPAARQGWLELYEAALRMLCRLWQSCSPESGLPGGYVRTAENGFENKQFVWDTCFTTLAAAYAHRAFPARASLDALYARQDDGGLIEREHDTRDNTALTFEPGFGVNPPLFAQAEWAVARLDGDAARLQAVRPVLEAHFEWIWHNRRRPDGTFWTTGLASGLDNSPGQGVAYPCLTAQMMHFAEYLARFARMGGDFAAADRYEERRRAIGEALETHLWDPQRRIYATPLAEGGFNPHKIVTAFWPLWAGCAQPDRVAALRAHLEDPASFNRPHPIPTLAADSPLYRPGGDYWRGSVWSPTNVATLLGFWRAGQHDVARAFTARHLDALFTVFRATDGGLWENYAPEASTPGSWSQKNYSWTAASPVTLLLEVFLGLEPDAVANTLTWTLPDEPGCGVENYPLGRATFSLLHQADGAVAVTTDAPFTLVLRSPNTAADAAPLFCWPLAAGRHSLSVRTSHCRPPRSRSAIQTAARRRKSSGGKQSGPETVIASLENP